MGIAQLGIDATRRGDAARVKDELSEASSTGNRAGAEARTGIGIVQLRLGGVGTSRLGDRQKFRRECRGQDRRSKLPMKLTSAHAADVSKRSPFQS